MSNKAQNESSILLIDDEEDLLKVFSLMLRYGGIKNVLTCNEPREALAILSQNPVSVVLLDLLMPQLGGEEVLVNIMETHPQIPVIVATAVPDLDTAVRCMKKGAFDYLTKPVDENRLLSTVKKALEVNRLKNELRSLRNTITSEGLSRADVFENIVTQSKKMVSLFKYIEAIGPMNLPILIKGETGVGKELIAKAIYDLYNCKGPFVAVNAAGLDDMVFTDTLFGHKKGAFTGADKSRKGLVEKAEGGVLFLDEIGDLKEPSQIKLLRLLQEGEYYPLGSDVQKVSNTRIIAATHRNLNKLVGKKEFRKDLFYRLNMHGVNIPPLRERLDDLPLLVDFFTEKICKCMGEKKFTVAIDAITVLSTQSFPGNIRELEAILYEAMALSTDENITGALVTKTIKKQGGTVSPSYSGAGNNVPPSRILESFEGRFPTLKEMEKKLVQEAMKMSNGNQSLSSRMLGVSRQTLIKKLKEV